MTGLMRTSELARCSVCLADCRAKQDAATALSAYWCVQTDEEMQDRVLQNPGYPGNGLRHDHQQLACSSLVFMIGLPGPCPVAATNTRREQ